MKKVNFFLFIIVMLFLSCKKETSDNVNQDKIWAEYQLIYDNNTKITYARAIFKFSSITGTVLELKDPAKVMFNNDLLTYNPTFGYYEKQYPSFVTTGTFKYTDLDNHTFQNTLTITDTVGFPLGLDTIYKSVPFELVWTGSPLKANETITVWLNSNVEGDSRLFSTNMLNSTSIIFPVNQMSQLGVGPYGVLAMERLYSPPISQATSAGGLITIKYKPKTLTGIQILN
ncbi:MAG: hypothetical protein HPY79_00720 [Bacteroidales bacterium]|nr:hypothetical protein [Bacteroidales bacterium]